MSENVNTKESLRPLSVLGKLHENEKVMRIMSMASNIMLLLFLFLITLGSYRKIKTAVLIVYLVICVFMALVSIKRMWRDFIGSPIMIMWLCYCLAGLLSSVFIKHEEDFYIVYTQISFTFVLFTLTRFYDPKIFVKMFRYYVIFMLACALFQEATGITVFRFLKEGTQYPYIDNKTLGIISIFEYRHYFGCYMLTAFFSLFFMPEEKWYLNLVYGAILLYGILISYTRSVWIALVLCLIILFIYWLAVTSKSSKKSHRMTSRTITLTVIGILVAIFVIMLFYQQQVQAIVDNVLKRVEQAFDPTDGSFRVRVYNAQHGTAYILEHWQKNIWIGMGNGTALEWLQTEEGAPWHKAIDCQYVTTFMETGLVGILSLLAMIFTANIYVYRRPEKEVKWFAISFLSICFSFFFFEVVVVSSSVYALFMLILCGICPEKKKVQINYISL